MKLTWIFLLSVVLIYLFLYEPADSWGRRRFRFRVRIRARRIVRNVVRRVRRVVRRVGHAVHRIVRVKSPIRVSRLKDTLLRIISINPKKPGNILCPKACMAICPSVCKVCHCPLKCTATCKILKGIKRQKKFRLSGNPNIKLCNFATYDRNGNGVLSAREIASPTKYSKSSHMNKRFFRRLDVNRDGVISKVEFGKQYFLCKRSKG